MTPPVAGKAGRRLRIAFILSGLSAGGAERVVALVAAHWVREGHEVTVIAFDAPGDPVYHPLDKAIRVFRLALPSESGASFHNAAWRTAKRIRALRALLRRERYDAVISFLFKINVITVLAASRLGIPIAIAERNHPTMQAGHPLWRCLRRWTYPCARLLILQTEASRSALPERLRPMGVVVHNPISRFERSPEPEGQKILAAVGRLDRQKGFDLLLKAFARIADRHPDWRLVIWGGGPDRAALEALRDRLGLAGRADLPGLSDGAADWIAQASAFVLSSRFEGFGNAMAEAMAAGLPVIAFDCEFGVGLMLERDVSGMVVPAEDIAALADGMDRLLKDRGLRERLGEAARVRAMRFSEENILHQWDAILPRLIE